MCRFLCALSRAQVARGAETRRRACCRCFPCPPPASHVPFGGLLRAARSAVACPGCSWYGGARHGHSTVIPRWWSAPAAPCCRGPRFDSSRRAPWHGGPSSCHGVSAWHAEDPRRQPVDASADADAAAADAPAGDAAAAAVRTAVAAAERPPWPPSTPPPPCHRRLRRRRDDGADADADAVAVADAYCAAHPPPPPPSSVRHHIACFCLARVCVCIVVHHSKQHLGIHVHLCIGV